MLNWTTIYDRLELINSTKKARFGLTLFMIVILVSTYLLLNHTLSPKIDLLLPLDEEIPYWPWTISVYITLYPMYLIAALSLDARRYVDVLIGVVAMTLISFVCFALITAHYPRPEPEAWAHSAWKPLIDLMISIDQPGNTCPSLHVSTSLYVGWMLKSHAWGSVWIFWGLIVSLSTLTLKQHFVWDWIGGLILASLVVIVQQRTSRDQKLS